MSDLKLLSKILRLKSLKVTNFWLKERELHLAVKPYDACRSVGSVSECFGVLDQREEDGLWALVRNRPRAVLQGKGVITIAILDPQLFDLRQFNFLRKIGQFGSSHHFRESSSILDKPSIPSGL